MGLNKTMKKGRGGGMWSWLTGNKQEQGYGQGQGSGWFGSSTQYPSQNYNAPTYDQAQGYGQAPGYGGKRRGVKKGGYRANTQSSIATTAASVGGRRRTRTRKNRGSRKSRRH